MLKKLVCTICIMCAISSQIHAKEVNIRDVDEIGWMIYSALWSPTLFKLKNRQEAFKSWYLQTYHPDVYAKVKNDQFDLDDAKEKYYLEAVEQIKARKVKIVPPNRDIQGEFVFDATGKIETYDFNAKAFIVTADPTNGITRTRNGKYVEYTGNPKDRKFVLRFSIGIIPHYLKMNKEKARELRKSLPEGKVLLHYKIPLLSHRMQSHINGKRPGPWADLRAGFRESTVEIINPTTHKLIGIGQSKP